MGRKVAVPLQPRRIISLVPSQTELLHYFGLEDSVVGITKFCIHPKEWFEHKTRIGGTKNVNFNKVKALNPDLIIGNKEENQKEDILELEKLTPVWMSDISNMDQSYQMIHMLSQIVGESDKGTKLVADLQKDFLEIKKLFSSSKFKKKVLYLIWRKPYMSIGSETFIHSIIEDYLQLENVLSNASRYPEVDLEKCPKPDYIFLSSEPYPFKAQHIKEIQDKFPESKVLLVDGEYFSWYGSRLLGASDYFKKLLKEMVF